VKPYGALARAQARSALAYPVNFVLGLGGLLFQLVALLAVWRVVLSGGPLGSFGWPQMRAYLLVAFASGVLVGIDADFRMAYRIILGDVALDLVKPVDYQRARFAEAIGGAWIEGAVVVLVGGVTVALFGGLPWPGWGGIALFVLSMVLLLPLKFLIVYMCALACFWTQHYVGIQWARIALVNLFSGALIPLAYLPSWIAVAAKWSPFAGLTSTPGLILIGQAHGSEGLLLVGVQLFWVIALWAAARGLWGRALRQLTVNGG
jgi:ABC-2 type transport system permease protein